MTKDWCDQKNKEYIAKSEEAIKKLKEAIENQNLISEESRTNFLKKLDDRDHCTMPRYEFDRMVLDADIEECDTCKLGIDCDNCTNSTYSNFKSWVKSVRDLVDEVESYYTRLKYYPEYAQPFSRYADSEPVHFEGDIIITDPCYILTDGEDHEDDWNKCEFGSEFENLGITHYMTRDTLYGDWSCTTWNADTEEAIGNFCADAGLVSVILLEDVLNYNPNYEDHLKSKWTVTLIPNFKGDVQFIVKETKGIYEDSTEYHTKGQEWVDYSVEVHGHGVDMKTGEPINFFTTQTGL